VLSQCAADRNSSGELQPLRLRLEPRSENLGVERTFKAVAHEDRVIIFDVHVELADVLDQKVYLAVVGKSDGTLRSKQLFEVQCNLLS
jgi:hypothetical protein